MIQLDLSKFYTIGHRGMEFGAVENTLDAVEKAIKSGLEFVELDLQFSKDGVPFLFHDKNLVGKTGMRGRIADHTSDVLCNLIVRNEQGRQPLASLEDLLKLITEDKHKSAKINLILELKHVNSSSSLISLNRLLKDYNIEDNVIIDSFTMRYLRMMQEINPVFFYVLLVKPFPLWAESVKKRYLLYLAKTKKFRGFSLHKSNINEHIVNFLKSRGLFIFGWGFKTPDSYEKGIQSGINGFTAPDPAKLLEILRNHETNNDTRFVHPSSARK